MGDTVNKPKHYNREGAMEAIDEMEMIYGPTAVMWFCLLNAHKYRYRAADKNGIEDLKKSDWYMKKFYQLKKKYPDDVPSSLISSTPTSVPTTSYPYLCSDLFTCPKSTIYGIR